MKMKKLSTKKFELAREYLHYQARSLDCALFQYHFEHGTLEKVLSELAQYQNSDGGFGNALEPDLRSPSSSALATEIALRILVELGVPSQNPLVVSAISFLLKTLHPEAKTWRVVPQDVNHYPHAPWWHDEAGSLAKTFNDFKVIPRAGILAALRHYPNLLPAGWLSQLTKSTISDLLEMELDSFSGGGDAVVYAQRLAEAPGLTREIRTKLNDRICQIADHVVTRDEASWSQYSAAPLKLAPNPKNIVADTLADCIPANLDFLVESQKPEGFWDVTWSWVDYPGDWQIAKTEWQGILTLEALMTLEAYERIENR
jgi:hypothetical protein